MLTRRRLLGALTASIALVVPGLLSVPIIGNLLAPLFERRPAPFVAVGAVADFPAGQMKLARFVEPDLLPWSGVSADTAVWVKNLGDARFDVFAVYCTHMGCPVEWRPNAKLFFCPCHGGVFHEDGAVAAPPPIDPLVKRAWRVRDGKLEVQPGGLPTLAPER